MLRVPGEKVHAVSAQQTFMGPTKFINKAEVPK